MENMTNELKKTKLEVEYKKLDKEFTSSKQAIRTAYKTNNLDNLQDLLENKKNVQTKFYEVRDALHQIRVELNTFTPYYLVDTYDGQTSDRATFVCEDTAIDCANEYIDNAKNYKLDYSAHVYFVDSEEFEKDIEMNGFEDLKPVYEVYKKSTK